MLEDVETVKKSLVDLAEEVWEGKFSHRRVSFKPSHKLRDRAKEFFGHDIDEVYITSDDVRHIKKHHSEHEEKRGQKSLTPKDFANIYDAVNDFESATLEESDKQGNKKMLVVLDYCDGKQYVLLIERGKNKAEIKTAYKKLTRMFDVTSPEPNVRNDSKSTDVSLTIPQTAGIGKDKSSIKQDTNQQEVTIHG